MEQNGPVEIFIDETGHTGPDLVNPDQPVFVVGSVSISTDDANRLVDAHFGGDRRRELKHTRLSFSSRGRRQLLGFFQELSARDNAFGFYVVHKEFSLFTHLVDFWIEPIAHADGLNLYERGGNIALSNVAYLTLGTMLGIEGRREFLRRFQVMTRDRTPFSYDSFWEYALTAIRRHRLLDDVLFALPSAERRLGWRHLIELPRHLLDLSDFGLIETVNWWREKRPNDTFELVHDASKLMERRRAYWEAILDPHNAAAEVGQDRRTIRFPLPVSGLQIVASDAHLQLQLADLVAGAAAEIFRSRITNVVSDYAHALQELGFLKGAQGGIWPSAAVTPEELETDGPVLSDAASHVAAIVRQHGVQEID